MDWLNWALPLLQIGLPSVLAWFLGYAVSTNGRLYQECLKLTTEKLALMAYLRDNGLAVDFNEDCLVVRPREGAGE